jgi:hypothetical protein
LSSDASTGRKGSEPIALLVRVDGDRCGETLRPDPSGTPLDAAGCPASLVEVGCGPAGWYVEARGVDVSGARLRLPLRDHDLVRVPGAALVFRIVD